MAKLNPQELSFKQLISQDKIYKIPQYQRNYSWTKENWEDLWDDILGIEDTKDKHYMGPIVLKEIKDSKDIEIIDGQQRFCSITLIVLATISVLNDLVVKGIDVEENGDLIKEIKENYIGKEGRLSPRRKLFLNKYDDPFFHTNLVEPYRVEPNKKDILPSHNEMKEAFKFFKKQLEVKFANKSGLELANFIHDTVMENLSFIVIYVTDEDNAYAIFETLNARGLELSNTDLLKNYLFSLVQNDPDDLKFIEDRWDKIIDIVGFKLLPRIDGRGGLSPKTVENIHLVVSSGINHALKQGLLIRNPLMAVNLKRGARPEIEIFTKEEQRQLIEECKKHHYGIAVTETENRDIEVYIQAFVVNVYGCIDNLAWILNCEKQLGLPFLNISLYNPTVQANFSEGFKSYLNDVDPNNPGCFKTWYDNHCKSFRHALGHRIPLYVPPFAISDAERYAEIGQEKIIAINAKDFQLLEQLEEEEKALEHIMPFFTHSFEEQAPIVNIHSQLIVDMMTIMDLSDKFFSELIPV